MDIGNTQERSLEFDVARENYKKIEVHPRTTLTTLTDSLEFFNPISPGLFLSFRAWGGPQSAPPIDLEKYSRSCDETWHAYSTSLA